MQAFAQVARRLNITLPSPASLKTALSRWENGQTPDPAYRRVFRELYGLTDAELGFSDNNTTPDTLPDTGLSELAGRLRSAERVDAELISVLDAQTHHLRLLDRRFGAAVILDQMSGHVDSVSGLLTHSVRGADREALARVLADAGALAGWQALDTGAVQRAWAHFTLARTAAAEAQRPALLAHALGEQAYALLELGRAGSAAQLIDVAAGTRGLPPLLRAWLAAAKGEMLAAAESGAEAMRAFDTAHALLPDERNDDALPFLALDEVHLARWRGNAMARLGRADAIDQLTAALARLDPVFARPPALCTLTLPWPTPQPVSVSRPPPRRAQPVNWPPRLDQNASDAAWLSYGCPTPRAVSSASSPTSEPAPAISPRSIKAGISASGTQSTTAASSLSVGSPTCLAPRAKNTTCGVSTMPGIGWNSISCSTPRGHQPVSSMLSRTAVAAGNSPSSPMPPGSSQPHESVTNRCRHNISTRSCSSTTSAIATLCRRTT